MAKQTAGYMGGFKGKLGPAVGYMWNGRWCMRSHQTFVHNPRTKAQTEHRNMFKYQVQTAACFKSVLNKTMLDLARENHMTVYNLFVSCNQHAFSMEGSTPVTDYSTLRLSMGDVAPVEEPRMTLTEHNTLSVQFGRGIGRRSDYVYMYVYVPDLEQEFFSLPVYRADRRVAAALPDQFEGHEAHVYLLVGSDDGRWAETVYVGSTAEPQEEEEPGESVADNGRRYEFLGVELTENEGDGGDKSRSDGMASPPTGL